MSSTAPLDPRDLSQLPVSAAFEAAYAPFYVADLQGADAWEKAVADLPAERRPLFEIGRLLSIWFDGRSTAEALQVMFSGQVGDHAPEIATALTQIGATRQAQALGEAIARFGRNYPRASADRSPLMGSWWDKPSRFAQDLAALDSAFGSREDLLGAFANHVCAHQELSQWLAQTRQSMSAPYRLAWVATRLISTYRIFGEDAPTRNRLRLLPPPYRALVLAEIADGEQLNGGVNQFFSNSSGAMAPETAAAMAEIGLPVRADIIRSVIARLPSPYPIDGASRRAALETITWAEFSALDAQWSRENREGPLSAFGQRMGVVPR